MAHLEKRGWVWNSDEKQWLRGSKTKLKRQQRQVSEQVRRFGERLPSLAKEASRVAQPFLDTAKVLLSLGGRTGDRKYQPMSPDDAKTKLEDAERALVAYADFTSREDVRDAIAEANKRTRTKEREFKKEVRQAKQQILDQLDSAEFDATMDAQVSELMKSAETTAALAQSLLREYGQPADLPILQRFVLVKFVIQAHEFSPDRRDEMRRFVHSGQIPGIRDVLKQTLHLLIRDDATHKLRHAARGLPKLEFLDPEVEMVAYVQSAFTALLAEIDDWQEKGISPKDISREHFELFGVDYSLLGMPDSEVSL